MQCPVCLENFSGHKNKVYCSVRCRREAERRQRLHRQRAAYYQHRAAGGLVADLPDPWAGIEIDRWPGYQPLQNGESKWPASQKDAFGGGKRRLPCMVNAKNTKNAKKMEEKLPKTDNNATADLADDDKPVPALRDVVPEVGWGQLPGWTL